MLRRIIAFYTPLSARLLWQIIAFDTTLLGRLRGLVDEEAAQLG